MLKKSLASLTNLMLRAATLGFRFVLSFYIIKYIGLDATGLYGLALGVVGIVPALVGWGLNYFTSREIVGKDHAFAAARVKSRLFVTTISLFLASLVLGAGALATGHTITGILLLVLAIVWLETYALDIHLPLVSQEMAFQANVLVFIRSALWVPFVIVLGLVFPAFRTIDAIFLAWISSYVVAIAALFYFLRGWPLAQTAREPVQYDWLKEKLSKSWLIYISDLSIVGLMYADRYIVNFMLGLTLTGIYTFFWSLTNALQTLTQTAVVQLALPVLVKAYLNGTYADWRHVLRAQFVKTTIIATVMSVGVYISAEILIHFMSMSQLREHRGLFILMLLAAVARSCSDLLNIGLTSLRRDNHYAMINLTSVVFSIVNAIVMIWLFGFAGTGIAALTTSLVTAAIRSYYLYKAANEVKAEKQAGAAPSPMSDTALPEPTILS